MLKPDELKYLEDQIKKSIFSIAHTHYKFIVLDESDEEVSGWTESWLENGLKDLYLLILVYFEGREMFHYLQTFRAKFESLFEKEEGLLEDQLTHPEEAPELTLIVRFKQYLKPFKFFDYRQVKVDETARLNSILRNSGFILKRMKAKVLNEADIYKQIKWILGLYYPSSRSRTKASFIEQFKSYNPDILIPELKTAIEYKFIDDALDNIDDFLDQLKIDATNYVDDHRYDTFYAVIYIEDISIATPEGIEVAWKSKRFPSNWNLILSGHTIKAIE